MVNLTPGNKFQWNFNRNSNINIHENAIENGVCEMASILPLHQCVEQLGAVPLILIKHRYGIWNEHNSFGHNTS